MGIGDGRPAWLRETLWSAEYSRVTPPGPKWPQVTLRSLTKPSCHNHGLTCSRARCRRAVTPYASVKSSLVLFQILLSSPLSSFTPSYSAISLFCFFCYWCKQILFHAYPVTFSLSRSLANTLETHLELLYKRSSPAQAYGHTNLYSFSSLSQTTYNKFLQGDELSAGYNVRFTAFNLWMILKSFLWDM